ncbi:MAG: MBL fold metallo-hydrolase [Desulfatibacillaceae bacterium]
MIEDVLAGIRWLGHDGFVIEHDGRILAIDPYQAANPPKADVICVTHEHFDHCSVEDIEKMAGPGTVIVTEPMSAAKLSGDVRTVAPGDRVEAAGFTIEAVPSYNTDKPFHPRENQWLGFVVDVGGTKVYHAGDTDFIPEMADLDVDIALLPVSGTYVMDWKQAVEAATAIGPGVAIPMHYGGIVGTAEDAENFRKELEGVCQVKILS